MAGLLEVSDEIRARATPPRRFADLSQREDALELEPLITGCPACGTRFRVTEAQLQAAAGRVRCGACGGVFDGVDHLLLDGQPPFATTQEALDALDDLMAELLEDSAPIRAPGPADAARVRQRLRRDDPATIPLDEPGSASVDPSRASAPGVGAMPVIDSGASPQASAGNTGSVHGRAGSERLVFGPPQRRPRRWVWLIALLAIVVLVGQVLWFRFDTLAVDPVWRPVYENLCGWLGCELPERRAIDRISTRHLSVRQAPGAQGMLDVRVVLRNEADFAQPFPALELQFSVLSGADAFAHRLQPHEYLDGDARRLTSMPPGVPVQLAFRVPDPGEQAVNYQLHLR